MRAPLLAFAVLAALAGPSRAQPLEQGFAFGAPPDVLGNDRVRVRRAPPDARLGRPEAGDIRVRFRGRQAWRGRAPSGR